MINQEVITAIHPLVEQINTAGYRLATSEQSPVGALNNAAYSPVIDTYPDEGGFIEAWQASLERHPVTGGVEPVSDNVGDDEVIMLPQSLHSLTMDEAVSLVTTGAMNARAHAQNVAKPLINSMLDKVETYIEHNTAIIEPFELVEVGLLDAWDNSIVRSALDKHRPTVNGIKRVARKDIPKIPAPADIDRLLVTGSGVMDDVLAKLLQETGMSATDVFNLIFNSYQDAGHLPSPVYLHRNQVLLCYLMANLLLDSPVENSGLELMQWETLMHKLISAYADACHMVLTIHQNNISAKVVVEGVSNDGRVLYLNSAVYDQWLDAGGSPEIIFGAHMNRRDGVDNLSFQSMLDNADVNQTVWGNYHASKRRLQETERQRKIKDAMHSSLLSELDDLDPRYYPPGKTKDELVADAKNLMFKMVPSDLADVGEACVKYACLVLFPHTNALRLLTDISAYVERGMEVEDAATHTINDYITDWIISGLLIYKG